MESMRCENASRPERRNAPRMPYRTAALYHTATEDGPGTIRNISPDGLFLETPFPLGDGEQIRIEFQLRNSRYPINISGEIARRTRAGVGVKLLWN